MTQENQIWRTKREKLIELMPELVKTSQVGNPTQEMISIIKSLDEDINKVRLVKILQSQKFLPSQGMNAGSR